jgi:hypothetical protein
LTVVPFDPYPFGLSFLPRRSFIFGFEIAAFESHSLRLGREADSPKNITADLFRAERIISRRTIRAETGPLELPLNEEQIPQIVEKQ